MFKNIISSIQTFGSFSQQHIFLLLEQLKVLNLKKDDFLIKEGHICQAFYFINNGSFRHYTVEDSGAEATVNLFIKNEWVFEYKSFMTQLPSHNNIQAIIDSEVFCLSVWDFHALVKISDGFLRIGRILEQAIQNQDFQHNRLSPQQKYERLLIDKPELLQQFPLKYIASYLGMSPETLSRIRRKISS